MKRSGKRKRSTRRTGSFRDRLVLWLNIPAAILLLGSWGASWADPAWFWPAAFIALAFPVMVLLNTAFVIYWLIRFRRHILISLLPLLVTSGLTGAYLRVGPQWMRSERDTIGTVKVVTYNVHGFDKNSFYTVGDASTPRGIVAWLGATGADVICMQEFYSNASRGFDMLDTCRRELTQPHLAKAYYRDDWRTFFLATFSHHPIGAAGKLRDGEGRGFALWTDISIGGDTIRFINVHLRSIRLSSEMDILESSRLVGEYNDPEFQKDARSILRKMKAAFIARSTQARNLREFMDNSPHAVILCGDLNDTPASYTYRKLAAGMQDTFKRSGTGAAGTYRGRMPSFRIDYILVDKRLSSAGFRTHDLETSDHYPLTVSIMTDK